MSRFMLKAGLVLGLLSGFAAVSQAEVPQQVVSAEQFGELKYWDSKYFQYYEDAHDEREYWRDEGYAANILQNSHGYWVRVYYEE